MELFKLSQVEIPQYKPTKISKAGYYLPSANGKIFDQLVELYNGSSTHASFVNNMALKVKGSGLISNNEQDTQTIKNYELNKLLADISFDLAIYGGFAIEVIWNQLHTKITRLNRLDFAKVRVGFIDPDTDQTELYYYSNDWYNWRDREIDILPVFNPAEGSDNNQIYYFKTAGPGENIYPTPIYYAGLKWIYTDVEVSKYYANLVKNNFVSNTILALNNGIPDQEKQVEFERAIKENFTSSENAGSMMVMYSDTKENAPEVIKFNQEADDAKYQWLSKEITDKLIVAHNIPSAMLAGVRVAGTLGGREELEIANHLYNVNVIWPHREYIFETINELNKYLLNPMTQYEINDIPVIEKNNEVK